MTGPSKRRWLAGLAIACMGGLVAGCSGDASTPSSELAVIRFCASGGIGLEQQPLLYAQSFGLLELYELLIERVDFADDATAFQALLAGDCDMLLSQADAGIAAIGNGANIKMIVAPAPWQDEVLLAPAGVRAIGDLAGRAIGVDRLGGLEQQAALRALKDAGVAPDSVNFVESPGGSLARGEAVAAGRLDAALMPALWAARAIQAAPDLHIVAEVGAALAGEHLNEAVFATSAILGDKRGVAQAAVNALIDASRSLMAGEQDADDAAAESGLDPHAAATAYAALFAAPVPYYAVEGGLDRDTVMATVADLRKSGRLAADLAYDDIVAPRFVENALKKLGPYSMAAPCAGGGEAAPEERLRGTGRSGASDERGGDPCPGAEVK